MDSRNRIIEAINHRQPDKVPVDLGASTVTGISAIAYNNLKKHIGIKKPARIFDVVQQLANVDIEIIDLFGVDALDINRIAAETGEWYEVELADGSKGEFPAWYHPEKQADGSWITTDHSGTVLSRMAAGATFFDQAFYPYENGYPDDFNDLNEALKKINWVVHSHASNLNAEELRNKVANLKKHQEKQL